MIKVVNEPWAEYQTSDWILYEIANSLFEESICRIETDSIFVYPKSGTVYMASFLKPKRKLSILRGKMTKESEKEIDDQISSLRSEWDRNI